MSIFKTLNFVIRGLLSLCILLTSATSGVFISLACWLAGKRQLAQFAVARLYYELLSVLMGVKVDVDRPEILRQLPAVIISNHQSEMDIAVLGKLFPPGCVITAKKSLQYVPGLGWFMLASGTFFLDRGNRKSSIDTLNKALTQVRDKAGGIYMFPEGTRSQSSTPTLLPLKKGAFHLAVQGQIPIIPVVVSNTSNLYSMKLQNFHRGVIKAKVLDPIPTKGLTKDDVAKLCKDTEDLMRKAVMELGYSEVVGEETPKWEAKATKQE